MKRLVAIVGRPNVGKSTLFNRLTESRDAIVDPESGVTRDRKFGKVEWQNDTFNIMDTGGHVSGSGDVFEEQIIKQVLIAIEESSLILFLVDVMTGITDLDLEIVKLLRPHSNKVLLISNKVDTSIKESDSYVFYQFGIGEQLFSISANNGYGTGDLLDKIIFELKDENIEFENDLPRIAIVGKPNVGKSTFINTLLGENRNIATDIAGTTRDAVDTKFQLFGFDFLLTDTAGIRKKSKYGDQIEFYANLRTYKAIESSDVCILLIDAFEGISKQDVSIFYQIVTAKKGIVIAVNKWDLIKKDTHTMNLFIEEIKSKLQPFNDVPIVFTSNVTKQRILKSLELALATIENKNRKIKTSKLNEIMLAVIERNPPPAYKGKYIRIKYITQLPSKSPAFAFFCNLPQYLKDPYKRFLENKMRDFFEFEGVPINLYFRKK